MAAALAAACVAGCSTEMAGIQPTLANLQAVRAVDGRPLAVGEFALAEGLPKGMDRTLSVRADSLKAPGDGSFSHFLRDTLQTQLRAAGKLDQASDTSVSGFLTQSKVQTGLPTSSGTLGARFIVRRGERTLFDRELTVADEWPSSFIGAIAIPTAEDHYTALYAALVKRLFEDEAFKAAIRPER